ncbi:carboxypeptidase-like regulatory domain-containing protein, partial [Methanobrevibacter sp.]|uniref:carboxypeptidase-like regulatory domain-containing protein n=1 Tax=Methanobrevibacter sp. TaxID=66852 RepID=UPI00388FA9CC
TVLNESSKKDLNLSAVADPIYAGENATVVISGFEDATGNVSALVNWVLYSAPIVDGVATFITNELNRSTSGYVLYWGDDLYNAAFTSVNITVLNESTKKDLNLSGSAEPINVGENATVVITGFEDATGNVSALVNLAYYNAPIVDGVATFTTKALDKSTSAYVLYLGDDLYNMAFTSVNITVLPAPGKKDLNLSGSAEPIYVGENATVVITGFEDATGNVSALVNWVYYYVPIVDGTVTFTTKALDKSTSAYVLYLGDDSYNMAFTYVNITVLPVPSKKDLNLSASAEPINVGENATVVITGFEDATGNVSVRAGNGIYFAPIVNGTAIVTVPGLNTNTTALISYDGDDNYNPSKTEVNITVMEPVSIIISAPDVTKYYSGAERFVVTVKDSEGNPLANKSVTVDINGITYNRTTNANGTCSCALNLPAGVYNVTTCVGNETVESVVTILTTVNGTDVVKVFRNGTQYYATFRDSEGNYLAEGTVVRFNIHGIFYDRKVSDKGLAKLNINLEQGEYIITAINLNTSEMSANNITVIPRIIENYDLTKYYRNASQYTVKIIGDDGNAVGAGVNVTFNINGVFYTRQTNASGIAKLNINLEAGDYIITTYYEECMVANNITVLPILSAEDMVKQYGTSDQFVATLVDGQGNPYARQTVQFNINGLLYNRVTDSLGQAKLNINLQPGEYIITSSYEDFRISNKITVTA